MKRYSCPDCGHVYSESEGDSGSGIPAGTAWEDVPASWECPDCGAPRSDFGEEKGCRVHVCSMCGFRVDEDRGSVKAGISPGTAWEDVPDAFVCPVCGCPKNIFKEYHDESL